MATTKIYNRFLQKLTATAAFGFLAATSQAGLFCDWRCDHKRPYCSPACDQAWGYHDTCWRQFPPTAPCTDWGAHCSANATPDGMNYGMGVSPHVNAAGPYTGVPMVPQIQQPLMLQQPLGNQNFQQQGPPIMDGTPQGSWNSYNANPALVPPSQQSVGPRSFGPSVGNGQDMPAESSQGGSDSSNSMDDSQLQLPGLDDDEGEFQLPAIPDLSRMNPYGNPGAYGQNYGNQYRAVSQQTATSQYGQPLLYPGNSAAAYPNNGMGNQQQQYEAAQYSQQPQYGASQQAYAEAMQQQAMQQQPTQQQQLQQQMLQQQMQQQQQQMMPGYSQPGNQYQAPQQGNYRPQQGIIQVAPQRQPSVVGVSFSRSIRPASNNMNVQQPMPEQKKSFLSKINPFSK